MEKLTPKKIKEIEDLIWREENINQENKFYFVNEKRGYSQEGYLLNNYYINLNENNGIWWMGIINLAPGENNLKSLLHIFKRFIKEKKIVGIWRHKDNIKLESLHNRVLSMFNGHRGEIKEYIYTIVKEV